MTSPTLLILAAGMGSRYGGLKQLDPVGPNGETIIDYSVYDAIRAGFRKLVFVTREDIMQPLKEMVGARFENRIAVQYVLQGLENLPPGFSVPTGRTRPWGTTHAILMSASAICEPFAVINADDFYGYEGYRTLANELQSSMENYAMVAFPLRNTLSDFGSVSRGICAVSEDGYLQSVVELTNIECDEGNTINRNVDGSVTRLTGNELVSMNMWGFTPRVFEQLGKCFQRFLERDGSDLRSECYISSSVNKLIVARQARVKVLLTNDAWFGVTHREDRQRVVEGITRLIRDGHYPKRLWS